jgi:hypothetical protein
LAFPGGATPFNLLPSARALIEQATAVADADLRLQQLQQEAVSTRTKLQNQIADLKSRIQEKMLQIETEIIKRVETAVENVACKVPVISLITCPAVKLVETVTKAYLDAQKLIIDLSGRIDELLKQLNDVQAVVDRAVLDKANALVRLRAKLENPAVQFGLDAAGPTLDKLQEFAKSLDDLVKKAAAGLSVPQPGQWNLQAVSLAVNGKRFLSFDVEGGRLKRDRPSVTYYPARISPEELFVFGLCPGMSPSIAATSQRYWK